MQRNSIYIVSLALWMACTAILYFYSLVFSLPFVLTVLLALAAALAIPFLLLKYVPSAVPELPRRDMAWITTGTVFIATAGLFLARKYGDWDAVYIYNLGARLLQDPDQWRQLFLYKDQYSHADYPLQIPAWVAFLQRLSGGGYKEWVPFVTGLFYTVAIPVVIFMETAGKNKVLSALIFIMIACNTYYLNNGVIQCTDVPLSFFLLLSFLFLDRLQQQPGPLWAMLSGIGLGCCLWTKNEGLLYALILFLFSLPALLRSGRAGFLSFAAGVLPFLLTLWLFKSVYAPVNDLVGGQADAGLLRAKLLDKERYKLIAGAFSKYISLYFYLPSLMAAVYLFFCVYRQVMPHRHLLVFVAFAIGIAAVYLLTPHDLAWHLDNSVSRILLQWYPAFLYVMAVQLGLLMEDGRKNNAAPAPWK